jgi:hypothetical protein
MLFSVAKDADKGYKEFIVKLLINIDNSILASNASMNDFIKKLRSERMELLIASVLKYRILTLTKPAEIEQFIKIVKENLPINNNESDLVEVYQALDSKLVLTEKGTMSVALKIWNEKPQEAVCTNSAHFYALEVLNDKANRDRIIEKYKGLIQQGFPSEKNNDYIRKLIEKLFKAQLDQNEFAFFIKLFARVPEYITELVVAILEITTSKQNDEWNTLIAVAIGAKTPTVHNTLIDECSKLKEGEKALAQLNDLLEPGEKQNYFKELAEKAKEIIRSKKPQSGLKRFLNLFVADDNDPEHKE